MTTQIQSQEDRDQSVHKLEESLKIIFPYIEKKNPGFSVIDYKFEQNFARGPKDPAQFLYIKLKDESGRGMTLRMNYLKTMRAIKKSGRLLT